MKKLAAVLAVLCTTTVAYARPSSFISLGPLISVPEIFGGFLSIWPDDDITIDLRATLSSVEGGVTGHIPFHRGAKQGSLWENAPATSRHDFLLTGMGGFVHRGVRAGSYSDETYGHGGRIIGAIGYGYQGSLDFRLQGGISAYDVGAAGWQLDPTFWASVGFFL